MQQFLRLLLALALLAGPAAAQTAPPSPAKQLMMAVVNGQTAQASQILAANPGLARQPISDNGATALMSAVSLGATPDLVTALIQGGSDVNFGMPDGPTVLTSAIVADQLPIVQLLLKSGANPNKADANGLPPLFYAISLAGLKNDAEAAKFTQLLLQNGANASAKVQMPQGGPLLTLQAVAQQLKAPQTAALLGP